MNTLLRCAWSSSSPISRIAQSHLPLLPIISHCNALTSPCTEPFQKRFAAWAANRKPKTKKKPEPKKKKCSAKYLLFNSRPRGRFPDIRPREELLTDYLPDEATIRLGVARIHMANRKPLYDAVVNREVNTLLSSPWRKIQFMGDLRKVSEENIKELALPDWLKSGLIGLAKATPKPSPPQSSSTTQESNSS